jgi:L-fuculose-phosphate aldolase
MNVSVTQDRRLVEEVAWSCRILAMLGYEDLTLGHVSARGSDESTIYIKRKGVALGEVTPQDILNVDLNSYDSNGAKGMHLETVLHTEVYKRRPDVRAVVHGHPPYATAFGATDAEFAYLTHDSVFFIDRIATYDGVPNLIIDEEQGAAVAEALGSRTVLMLRNHGVLVAERDLRWVTLASALLERTMQLQAMASSIGPLHPIPDQLLQGIHERKYQPDFAAEYWEAWVRTLRREGRALGMPEES